MRRMGEGLGEREGIHPETITHIMCFSQRPLLAVLCKWFVKTSQKQCDPGAQNQSEVTHRYICRDSQQYIVWVKIIDFSFMPKIIRILIKDHVP